MAALDSMTSSPADETPTVPRNRSDRLPAVVRLVDKNGRDVAARCEVAESAFSRMRGLLGRDGLAEGSGLFINPCPSIQTFFMRFPIDVVFLGKDKQIVGISHVVKPWRTAHARGAYAALELPAGTAKRHGLEIGDVFSIVPLEE
jgi:hypothetical protein